MARQLPVVEAQAGGWRADETEQGLLRVQTAVSGLVKLPFRYGQFTTSSEANSASPPAAQFQASVAPAWKEDILRENSDGSCSGFSVVVPNTKTISISGIPTAVPASDGNCYVARIVFAFPGRVLALRWAKGISSTTPRDFSCIIDGVAHNVSNQIYDPKSGAEYETPCGEACEVIADNLSDGMHHCELVFPGAVDQANRWTIYGYAIEERLGVIAPPRCMSWCNPQVLTASMAYYDASHHGESSAENWAQRIRKIAYSNSSASPVTVTIENYYNSTSATLAVLTCPANGSVEYDFGGSVAYDIAGSSGRRALRHKASTTSVITAQALGVF